MWIEVEPYRTREELQKEVACPAQPITIPAPGADPRPSDADRFPPNSCPFWCGQLANGQSCTAVINPPPGHVVTCTVIAPGTSYDGNDILVTLTVGSVSTTLRGEG